MIMANQKLKTLIIEDEESASIALRNKIVRYCPQLEIVGECKNVTEGIDQIIQHRPSLVFLDIRLQNESGFDVIDKIPSVFFKIVFVTAYNEYAIKAFQYNALYYLLKPIQTSELIEAVERVIDAEETAMRYKMALEQYTQNKWERIAVPSVSKVTYIKISELIRIQSDGTYSELYLDNGKKIISTKPIKTYDALLAHNHFYRVHRSHLVNLTKIEEYQKGEQDVIILSDSSKIEISRKKRTDILSILQTKVISK